MFHVSVKPLAGILAFFFVWLTGLNLNAQNIALQPPVGVNTDGSTTLQLLFKQTKTVRLNWSQNVSGLGVKLLIGRQKGDYSFRSVNVSGQTHQFVPGTLSMTTGRYYARLTNSSFTSLADIQADPRADKLLSNEIEIIIESPLAPKVNAPRGEVTDATPTFSWDAVPGVPAYWIIFSSTPFEITTDAADQIKIQGANVVWQFITSNSTARYGEVNPDVTYYDIDAPPLNPGQEYSFAILNIYENNNPVYASPVFGGVVPMRYVNPNAIPKPTLIEPAAGAVYNASETITFRWSEVTQAASYGINLYQVITQQGVDVTIPIWSTTTTNTIIDYPAASNLKNAVYNWNVVAYDGEGGGTTSGTAASPTLTFRYSIQNGQLNAYVVPSNDRQNRITGVELFIKAVSGGVTPSIPAFLQTTNYTDSLVVGSYQITAKKDGYADTTFSTVINARQTSFLEFVMRPLPAFLGGFTKDEAQLPVSGVRVTATNQLSGEQRSTDSDVTGAFRIPLNAGSYQITAVKPGHISPLARLVSVADGSAVQLPEPLRLQNDRATIAGAVLNESGGPIQNARVIAKKGTLQFETRTDGTGVFSLVLSSGVWDVNAEKSGFVPSTVRKVTLTVGDQLQNQNISLAGRANTVSGFIREKITNSDGTSGFSPRSQASVTATPSAGQSVTVLSNSNGQFTLSLGTGNYVINVSYPGYSVVENAPQMVLGFGETYSGINFSLEANPSSVSGRIVSPSGTPVADVLVSVPGIGQTFANASGLYTLSLPAGNHSLSATRSGFVTPPLKTIGLSAGQRLAGIDFTMSANAGTVSGRIVSAGNGVADATIQAVSTQFGTTTIKSGQTGEYSLSLQPGSWRISALKSGFVAPAGLDIALSAGQTRGSTDFLLQANTRTIRGIVTDGTNTLRNVEIALVSGSTTINTLTQPNGVFSAQVEGGKAYSISARLSGYRTVTITTPVLQASTDVYQNNISLQANPASISGTVSDQNLRILPGAKVLVLQTGTLSRLDSVVAGSNGAYQIGLGAGDYVLRSELPGYLPDETTFTLAAGENATGVGFSLTENFSTLSGRIISAGNEPLESVLLTLTSLDGGVRTAQSDQNGQYSIGRIPTGAYTFSVQLSGFTTPSVQTISFGNASQISRDFTLSPNAGTISGTVLDANNNPVADAVVTASSTDGKLYQVVSNASGVYAFSKIELGSYSVSASKTGFTSLSSSTVVLSTTEPTAENREIGDLVANNGTIRGNITDLGDNSRLSGVQIQVSSSNGSGSAVSTSTGAYAIANLAPGNYTAVYFLSGWEPDTTTVEITTGSAQVSLDRQLVKNAGRLTGKLVNQQNAALDFLPTLKLSSSSATYTTRADEAGNFIFDNIKTGTSYTLTTEIYRDGYSNISRQVAVPRGASTVNLDSPVQVNYRGSSILGTTTLGAVPLPNVTLSLLQSNSTAASQSFVSETDGTFRFRFLAEGSYLIVPRLAGYVFSPDTIRVTAAFSEQRVVTTSATPNIGTITASVTFGGAALNAVTISVVSSDNTVIRTLQTGTNGQAVFSALPAGKSYSVRASRSGYTADPVSREIALQVNQNVTAAFTFSANSSSLAGRVVRDSDNSPIPEAILRARLISNNQIYEQTSDGNGNFILTNLPAGTYRLTARKSGFSVDTLFNLLLTPGQQLPDNVLKLQLAALQWVGGRVMFGNQPVAGVQVTASATSQFTAVTGNDGYFFINNLPVKPGLNDTTVYTFSISTSDFSASQKRIYTPDRIGSTEFIPNFNLPSGQISLVVSDGVAPLSGVKVQFVRVGGATPVTALTSADGKFTSSNKLRASGYSVDISRSGYLLPERPITLALPTDTTILSTTVKLPYTFTPVAEIRADAPAVVSAGFSTQYTPSLQSAELFYRIAGQSTFRSVAMSLDNGRITGSIPAQFSLEDITYYIRIVENGIAEGWISAPQTIKPLASGILTRVRMTPDLSDQILRTNDEYEVNFTVFDGVNQNLESKFVGTSPAGQLNVNSSDYQPGISVERSGMNALFRPTKAGTYRFKIEARLNGLVLTRDISLVVTGAPVNEITVSRPASRVVNTGVYTFTYAALDSARKRILMGKNKEWFVDPPARGTVSPDGIFTPASVSTIGNFRIGLRDKNSTKSALSNTVSLFAVVQPQNSVTLVDGQGMSLQLPAGSLASTAEFSFIRSSPESTKKYVRPKGSDNSYVVSDTSYRIVSTLTDVGNTARITLPVDRSLRHVTGNIRLGLFSTSGLEWSLLEAPPAAKSIQIPMRTSENPDEITATGFVTFGQFALMAENQDLNVHSVAVLPTPFSPVVGPAKIGYVLETIAPPAEVNIVIYNMRGELVRTILKNDLQFPGRYGSRTGLKEISWDGLTDHGKMALNGRYIIEIKAKDSRREQKQLIPIVLVK